MPAWSSLELRGLAPQRSGALAGSITGSADQRAVNVTAGVVYGGVLEYGWAAHRIPAQPYLRPAASETEPEWAALYQKRVDDLLGKVSGG